ncbi:hypothetical protein BDQ94DRAFT_135450, partial [Aspergillus welwitschiae]
MRMDVRISCGQKGGCRIKNTAIRLCTQRGRLGNHCSGSLMGNPSLMDSSRRFPPSHGVGVYFMD